MLAERHAAYSEAAQAPGIGVNSVTDDRCLDYIIYICIILQMQKQ